MIQKQNEKHREYSAGLELNARTTALHAWCKYERFVKLELGFKHQVQRLI